MIFGWDASHYDGRLSRAILERARAEGISFFTHKVAEATNDTEHGLDDTALAAARDAGVPFIGGYFVVRTRPSVAAQVTAWVNLLNLSAPWWRDFDGFFTQVDLERWSYDNVPASAGIEAGHRLQDATGRRALLYASHGQYGDGLAAWDGPLWNADYVSRPAAGFKAMYPGDSWIPSHGSWRGGWAPYSGKAPAVLQYTSSATIGGLSTCDANAFRGTVADFAALIGGATITTSEGDAELDANQSRKLDDIHYTLTTNDQGLGAEHVRWATAMPLLQAIAAKVDVDPAELDAIRAAAREGAMSAADGLVAAVLAKLPEEATITKQDVEQAVRDAFAGGLAPATG